MADHVAARQWRTAPYQYQRDIVNNFVNANRATCYLMHAFCGLGKTYMFCMCTLLQFIKASEQEAVPRLHVNIITTDKLGVIYQTVDSYEKKLTRGRIQRGRQHMRMPSDNSHAYIFCTPQKGRKSPMNGNTSVPLLERNIRSAYERLHNGPQQLTIFTCNNSLINVIDTIERWRPHLYVDTFVADEWHRFNTIDLNTIRGKKECMSRSKIILASATPGTRAGRLNAPELLCDIDYAAARVYNPDIPPVSFSISRYNADRNHRDIRLANMTITFAEMVRSQSFAALMMTHWATDTEDQRQYPAILPSFDMVSDRDLRMAWRNAVRGSPFPDRKLTGIMITSDQKFYVEIDPNEEINEPVERHRIPSSDAGVKFAQGCLARLDDGTQATLVMSARMLGTGIDLKANLVVMTCDVTLDRDGEPTEATAANIVQKIARILRATSIRLANGTHKTARVIFLTQAPIIRQNGIHAIRYADTPEAVKIAMAAYNIADENIDVIIPPVNVGEALPDIPNDSEDDNTDIEDDSEDDLNFPPDDPDVPVPDDDVNIPPDVPDIPDQDPDDEDDIDFAPENDDNVADEHIEDIIEDVQAEESEDDADENVAHVDNQYMAESDSEFGSESGSDGDPPDNPIISAIIAGRTENELRVILHRDAFEIEEHEVYDMFMMP